MTAMLSSWATLDTSSHIRGSACEESSSMKQHMSCPEKIKKACYKLRTNKASTTKFMNVWHWLYVDSNIDDGELVRLIRFRVLNTLVEQLEYTMVAKEPKMLQHCLYNAVSWAVTLSHQQSQQDTWGNSCRYFCNSSWYICVYNLC